MAGLALRPSGGENTGYDPGISRLLSKGPILRKKLTRVFSIGRYDPRSPPGNEESVYRSLMISLEVL